MNNRSRESFPAIEKSVVCTVPPTVRRLYRTADGTAINADINGALNIARKELGDEWLKSQLKANGGRMNRPVSVRNIGLTLKEGLRSLETASVRAR